MTNRRRMDSDEHAPASTFAALEPGRKGEILAAALQVFSDSGYDCGSMRTIAAAVGVSEPALYRYFSGKEAILGALMSVVATRLRNEVLSVSETFSADGLREQMIAALKRREEMVDVYGPLLRIILPVAARSPRLRAEYRELVIVPATKALMEKAAELDAALGVSCGDDTRSARVRSLLALVAGYIVSTFVIEDEPEEAIVDAALRVMDWER